MPTSSKEVTTSKKGGKPQLQLEQLGQACRNCDRHCEACETEHDVAGKVHHPLPSAAEIAVGASWGCLSAWIFMCFKSLNMYTAVGEDILDTTYLVSIICVCAILFAAGHFDALTERCLKKAWFRWLLPIGMTVSTLLMVVGVYNPGNLGTVTTYVAGVLSGFFSGLFLLRIGVSFSKLCLRACVIGAAAAIILQPLLFALFLLFGPFEAMAFAASMPIVASILLTFGMKELERKGIAPGIDNECIGDALAKTEIGKTIAQNSPFNSKERKAFAIKLAFGGGLVGFASESARTLYIQMGTINLGAESYALGEALAWFVATIVIVALALALLNMKTERMARNCYHTVMIMLIMSLLLLPASYSHGQIFATMSQAANSASLSCFTMLIWVVTISFAARHSNATIRILATARAGWAVGPLVGMLLGRYVFHNLGIDGDDVLLVMILGVLTVLVGMGFAFSETDLARCMDILPLQRKQHFRDKCLKLAQDNGLTDRETGVMVLLAKGNSLAYIQDQLLISKSTASTHRQHIYRKLGIHSQQELIDKVQSLGE